MAEAQLRLTTGQVVRCRNEQNPEPLIGRVLLASDTDPQSVAVFLETESQGFRMNGGGIAISNMLPLTVDYEREIVTDLFGNEWEIDVAEAP